MVKILPTIIKKFYNTWNIQGFILFSLCLQITLVLLAPLRKRSRNPIIVGLIWLSYVLADWAASFAAGLISKHQHYAPTPDDVPVTILVFWTPFLLLHLGGPDTISALSLEDNTLRLRHFFGLVTQVLSTIVVFSQSLPRSKLWVSTVLIFVAGTIKYVERTCALCFANLNKYQESTIKEHVASIKDHYEGDQESRKEAIKQMREHLRVQQPSKDEMELDDVQVVKHAHTFLKIFKVLIADVFPEYSLCWMSQVVFLQISPGDAFRVLEVELNLFYELFYTKVVVIYSKLGCIVRFISWCVVVVALSTFCSIDKHDFRKIDVGISYTLLFGAIGVDAIAFIMLAVSDWTVFYIDKFLPPGNGVTALLKYFLTLKRTKQVTSSLEVSTLGCFGWFRKLSLRCFDWVRGMIFWRWSGSIHTYNFIDYCLKEHQRNRTILGPFIKLTSAIGCLKNLYDSITHVSKEPVKDKLWNFIFTELKRKSSLEYEPNSSSNIDKRKRLADFASILQENDLNNACLNFDYHHSLLIWHIVTDVCYNIDEVNSSDQDCCEISKILSDYMLYLLVMQPTLMFAVSGIIKIRFNHTYAHTIKFFSDNNLGIEGQKEHGKVRKEILDGELGNKIPPVSGDSTTSVLHHAYTLAKALKRLDSSLRWKLISKVWLHLLAYAASHCRADTHVAQLSKGGEFITFVWLLMAHLGLGDSLQSYTGIEEIVAEIISDNAKHSVGIQLEVKIR